MGDSSAWDNGKLIKSVPDAVGRILKEYAERLTAASSEPTLFDHDEKISDKINEEKKAIPGAAVCPTCGEKAYVKTRGLQLLPVLRIFQMRLNITTI